MSSQQPKGGSRGRDEGTSKLFDLDGFRARDDVLFFGYVVGDFPELGYFRLSELTSVRGAGGLPVERDQYFTPLRLSELKTRGNG